MDHYDALVIAGDEPYWLSRSLYDLSREVGIPAPHFYGNREYNDYNGGEKWHITTVIQGRDADPMDSEMVYTVPYPSFEYSVGQAMQGAISRICSKYRTRISHGSFFRLLGERTEAGDVINRSNQHTPPIRHHLMELEFVARNSELQMIEQFQVIAAQKERIKRLEKTLLRIADHNDELVAKDDGRETLVLATKAQCAHFAMECNQMDKIKEDRDKLKKEVDELQEILAQMTVAQEKQKPIAPPTPTETEEEEEEDPEERVFEISSDEEGSMEEDSTGSSQPPKKRMKAPQYVKLFKVQP